MDYLEGAEGQAEPQEARTVNLVDLLEATILAVSAPAWVSATDYLEAAEGQAEPQEARTASAADCQEGTLPEALVPA